jgi:hypothetical protein
MMLAARRRLRGRPHVDAKSSRAAGGAAQASAIGTGPWYAASIAEAIGSGSFHQPLCVFHILGHRRIGQALQHRGQRRAYFACASLGA